jgi:type VI protein secretion system component VasK
MDRDHSRLVVILLAGILLVLLFGREATIEAIGSASWVLLVIGAVITIIWMILGTIRYTRQEAKLYSEDDIRHLERRGAPAGTRPRIGTVWTFLGYILTHTAWAGSVQGRTSSLH